ncbi:hypothetical protein [Winogradskyella vidalii]|uniref:hypothetical protein n=1 Tax=Winogradskyella vidalii TaxID=2615024 RepID=UPI0015CDB881|nr:hypothetical protein [Winogradskyella vidalii]
MKKFKLTGLLKVFTFLILIQFAIGLADVFLAQSNSDLASITSILITICSYPIGLINSNLPFYVSEDLFMVGLYWVINVIIQAIFLYLILIVLRKMNESS